VSKLLPTDDPRTRGACKDAPEVFGQRCGRIGPDRKGLDKRSRAAKAVCDTCPIKAECAEYFEERFRVRGPQVNTFVGGRLYVGEYSIRQQLVRDRRRKAARTRHLLK
jgi:hypothetical protein